MSKANARTPIKVVQPQEVAEVADLLKVEVELQEHIAQNPEFYNKLCELASMRNDKLQAAEKVVRAMGVTCGPFIKKSETTELDSEKLYDELGPDVFVSVGGYTETVTMYKIDRTRFLTYLAAGNIPKEVAETCTKLRLSYSKPDPFVLP